MLSRIRTLLVCYGFCSLFVTASITQRWIIGDVIPNFCSSTHQFNIIVYSMHGLFIWLFHLSLSNFKSSVVNSWGNKQHSNRLEPSSLNRIRRWQLQYINIDFTVASGVSIATRCWQVLFGTYVAIWICKGDFAVNWWHVYISGEW